MITVAMFTFYDLLPGYISKHYIALLGNKTPSSYLILLTETCAGSVWHGLYATYIMNKRNSQRNPYPPKSLLYVQQLHTLNVPLPCFDYLAESQLIPESTGQLSRMHWSMRQQDRQTGCRWSPLSTAKNWDILIQVQYLSCIFCFQIG